MFLFIRYLEYPKIQGIYFKIQGTYFKICALCFLQQAMCFFRTSGKSIFSTYINSISSPFFFITR